MKSTSRNTIVLLALASALFIVAQPNVASAGIGGKTYCGLVLPQDDTADEDSIEAAPYCGTFETDGSLSGEGGLDGTWNELDFGFFGIWTATATIDDETTHWTGIHVLSYFLNGVGVPDDEDAPTVSFVGVLEP